MVAVVTAAEVLEIGAWLVETTGAGWAVSLSAGVMARICCCPGRLAMALPRSSMDWAWLWWAGTWLSCLLRATSLSSSQSTWEVKDWSDS